MVVVVLVLCIGGGFGRHGLGLILATAAANLGCFFFSSSEFGLLDCGVLGFKMVSFGICRTGPKPIQLC